MLKPGQIVYFDRCKVLPARKKEWIKFTGESHGIGLLLGHHQAGMFPPPPVFIFRMLGTLGFISFDDVLAFLGEEHKEVLMKKWDEKYIPKPKGPELVGPDGKSTTVKEKDNASIAGEK